MKFINYKPSLFQDFVAMMTAQMDYHRGIADPENFKGYSRKMMEDYCNEIIARAEKPGAELLFVTDADKLCGFISWYGKTYDAETTRYILKTAIVDEMYVKPDCRGQGCATWMLEQLEKHLKSLGYEIIRLTEVHASNLPASNLYRKLGYKIRVSEFAKLIKK